MDSKIKVKFENVLRFSDAQLIIFNGLLSINYVDIDFVGVSEAYGNIAIKLKVKLKFKLNFFQRLKYPKISYDPALDVVFVDIYQALSSPKSEDYYEFIGSVLSQTTVPVKSFVSVHLGKFVEVWDYEKEALVTSQNCPYCDNVIQVNLTFEPFVLICPHCSNRFLEAYCMKCARGGFIFHSPKSDLGTIEKIESQPNSWMCSGCKNNWKLDKEIYEKRMVYAKMN
ncbi:hypothetical protein KBD45_03085 [Candidatus Dojkabacteria bacterium]|nr:hypothetical protein [Candidatus Dojkabacteria bacterium]